MPTDKLRLHRRSIRLKDYDYSLPGAYFVTLVTHARDRIFGEVQGEGINLSRAGQVVELVWKINTELFPGPPGRMDRHAQSFSRNHSNRWPRFR